MTFALDKESNPHPRMLAVALKARRSARFFGTPSDKAYWKGYRQAMADATGCDPKDIEEWMDHNLEGTTKAREQGDCALCEASVQPGDWIMVVAGRQIHEDCL